MNITFDQFEETYKPQINQILRAQTDDSIADSDVAPFNGWMYETYDEEHEAVMEAYNNNPKTVWTIVDAEGEMVILSGFHHVNRIGHIITEVPCEHEKGGITVED